MDTRLKTARLKAIFLARMGCRSGAGVWDKAVKSDVDQMFLVRGEDLDLISQADNESFRGKEKKK